MVFMCFCVGLQNGSTAMMCAAYYGHVSVVEYLHLHGAGMDLQDEVRP